MRFLAHIATASIRCVIVSLVFVCAAQAQNRDELVAPVPPRSASLDLLNPVALLSQAIATLIGADAQHVMLGSGARYAVSFATPSAAFVQQAQITVPFASGGEHDKVSLLLAQSQLRVRLAQDLQLRCEVSSRDEANTDPELKLDLGVQFKFK